ncbi:hypothetical protein KCU81_g3242, partial [Aureobasidium melanogenum]
MLVFAEQASLSLPNYPSTLSTTITLLSQIAADTNHTTSGGWRHMRRDPDGVDNIGRDGVLRSLNADRTAVPDVRRLSPEEIKEFAEPFGQATMDALVGVDGRDITDEAQLWAVPTVNTVAEESRIYKPAVPADQKSGLADSSSSTPAKRA